MPSAKKELSKCLQVYTASGKTDAALSWSIQINTIVELGFFIATVLRSIFAYLFDEFGAFRH